MTGYATGAGNQLTNDGTYTYTYDNEGNLTKKSKGAAAETWNYSYDNRDQMVGADQRATDGGTLEMRATYVYDVYGQRIEKDVWTQASGTVAVTRMAYDGTNSWADLDGGNALVTRRLYGDGVDQLLARVTGGTGGSAGWYLTDHLGSVRNVTDGTGALTGTLSYDPFGSALTDTGSTDRYAFTARERDTETGLQHNGARYYDAATGRWTSPDPAGFGAGDANLYRYAGNDSTNYTDPLGLQDEDRNMLLWAHSYYKGGTQIPLQESEFSTTSGLKLKIEAWFDRTHIIKGTTGVTNTEDKKFELRVTSMNCRSMKNCHWLQVVSTFLEDGDRAEVRGPESHFKIGDADLYFPEGSEFTRVDSGPESPSGYYEMVVAPTGEWGSFIDGPHGGPFDKLPNKVRVQREVYDDYLICDDEVYYQVHWEVSHKRTNLGELGQTIDYDMNKSWGRRVDRLPPSLLYYEDDKGVGRLPGAFTKERAKIGAVYKKEDRQYFPFPASEEKRRQWILDYELSCALSGRLPLRPRDPTQK
jgi:RHS repeat-associated protein